MTISVGRYLKRKTRLVRVKAYINKDCNLQKSFQLARILCCFQRKPPKCKYWDLKVQCLETQMACSGRLKNDSLCLCMKRSSKCCAACRCNGLGLCLALRIFVKNYLPSFLYHHHSQEHFLTATSLVHLMWKCS